MVFRQRQRLMSIRNKIIDHDACCGFPISDFFAIFSLLERIVIIGSILRHFWIISNYHNQLVVSSFRREIFSTYLDFVSVLAPILGLQTLTGIPAVITHSSLVRQFAVISSEIEAKTLHRETLTTTLLSYVQTSKYDR